LTESGMAATLRSPILISLGMETLMVFNIMETSEKVCAILVLKE